jgi:hypothetical protein
LGSVSSAFRSPNFDQFIGIASPQLSIAGHLLQFLVEKFIAPRPINPGVDRREEKGHERREIAFEHLFPG